MHDSFEKKVQEKMEGLQLTPSQPVWEKIELAIRPERKRRVVFWWLLLGLLVGGGAVYLSRFNKPGTVANETAVPVQTITQRTTKPPLAQPPVVKSKPSSNDVYRSQVPVQETTRRSLPAVVQLPVVSRVKRSSTPPLQNAAPATASMPVDNKSSEPEQRTQAPPSLTPSQPATKITSGETVAQLPAVDETAVDKGRRTEQKDSSHLPSILPQRQPQLTDTAQKKKVVRRKAWQNEVQLTVGRSSYADPLIGGGQKSLLSPMFNSPGTVSPPPAVAPSPPTGGFAFTVGVQRRRQLSAHWSVAVGLHYSYLSTQQDVGMGGRNDTSFQVGFSRVQADALYRTGTSQQYTNRFHVVDLPLTVSLAPQRLPVAVSVGLAYGRVVHTTALAYSASSGFYYRNSEGISKNRLLFNAAAQFRLKRGGGKAWQTGPALQYNLLRTHRNAGGEKDHLLFLGWQTNLVF